MKDKGIPSDSANAGLDKFALEESESLVRVKAVYGCIVNMA
jgi:hypothetical protein